MTKFFYSHISKDWQKHGCDEDYKIWYTSIFIELVTESNELKESKKLNWLSPEGLKMKLENNNIVKPPDWLKEKLLEKIEEVKNDGEELTKAIKEYSGDSLKLAVKADKILGPDTSTNNFEQRVRALGLDKSDEKVEKLHQVLHERFKLRLYFARLPMTTRI